MNGSLEKYTPKLMVLPTFLILLIISLVPLIYVLGISFTASTIAKPFNDFVWFENYKKAFTDEIFGHSLVNTLLFAFIVTTIQTFLGFVLAFTMQRERTLSGVLRTLALLPLFTPPVAIAMIWRLIYDPNQGLLNYYLLNWGLSSTPIAFLGERTLAFPAIMLADIWQWTPFCFLLCLAALQSLPRDPYEAAMVDGASAWYVFRRLTLPMVAPQIIVIFLFRFLIALKVFDLIYMLTFGGPGNATQVASFYIYRVSFKQFQTGYGGALSILVLILISILATLLTKGREFLLSKVER
ncbi:MAG: sugar ABC transporter permease [Anaerolineae bacterium]|nr:sugar ABC transporter permease [Anaerolineae bacterium]